MYVTISRHSESVFLQAYKSGEMDKIKKGLYRDFLNGAYSMDP